METSVMKSIGGLGGARDWTKLGLVYDASKHVSDWAKHSALTPTPFIRKTGEIRVLCGFRDDAGVSRIGYVDIDPENPRTILNVSKTPALDTGRDGCFDDNGVILGDVVRIEDRLFLFYVGFQLVNRVKFLAFTGLAVSDDDGGSFVRITDAPILDRHKGENFFAAVHTAMYSGGKWKLWYGAGDTWYEINQTPYPSYGVNYVETEDLLNIPYERSCCISPIGNEYRVGRPRVHISENGYMMLYTAGTVHGDYFPGSAVSIDGIKWQREEGDFFLPLSADGWDSKHLSYPSILPVNDRLLVFYNGNDMGRNGFGIAELKR